MQNSELVSFIIPNYNYAHTLSQAINSLLQQTYENFEIIIVDDGSKDNSLTIIKDFQKSFDKNILLLTHSNNQNQGLASSLKLGLKYAQGTYIAILEADDFLEPTYLEKKISIIKENTNISAIFNKVKCVGDLNLINHQLIKFKNIPQNIPFNSTHLLMQQNPFASFSCLFTKKYYLEKIHFDSDIQPWLDWWIFYQLSFLGKFYLIAEPLTHWRLHLTSYNNSNFDKKNIRICLIKKQLNFLIENKYKGSVLQFFGDFLHLNIKLALNWGSKNCQTIIKLTGS